MGSDSAPTDDAEGGRTMMTNTEQITATLQSVDAPICDDCLAMRSTIDGPQAATGCQQLADHGDVDREQGTCAICGKAKIVNSLIYSRNVPG